MTTVRVATVSDATAIAEIYAPAVRDSFISFEADPPAPDEMARRIDQTLQTHPWLVAEHEGEVTGYAYASKHRERAAYRWAVDVAVYIRGDRHRTGIGRALYERLIEILRMQGFHTAFAGIALPNPASIRLHEAFGFKLIGTYKEVGFKGGQWLDVGWWELILSDAGLSPDEPKPFASIRDRYP